MLRGTTSFQLQAAVRRSNRLTTKLRSSAVRRWFGRLGGRLWIYPGETLGRFKKKQFSVVMGNSCMLRFRKLCVTGCGVLKEIKKHFQHAGRSTPQLTCLVRSSSGKSQTTQMQFNRKHIFRRCI